MRKQQTEEQFPLLMFLVGDNDNISKNNKRFWNGGGRFNGITTGASAIITEWPNYLTSCWITALLCGLTLFVFSLLMMSCMSLQYNHRLPRCVKNYNLDNRTIHLVHTSRKWNRNQLYLIENMTLTLPNYKIHIIIIESGAKNDSLLLKTLNGVDGTIEDFQKKNPNFFVVRSTYEEVFANSPLFLNWVLLNESMRIFAIRIIQLWQFGGLSFDLLEFGENPKDFVKVQKLIETGSKRFDNLRGVSVDLNGFHMETKIPCHAFFGKILMKLRRINGISTPRGVLYGPLFTFCRIGEMDKHFCINKSFLLI